MPPPEHVQRVLEHLHGVKKQRGDGWSACCPAHEDDTASLSVDIGKNQGVLLKCFAGCTLESILAALQLQKGDLWPPKPHRNGHATSPPRRIVATYDYTDEAGTVLFQVVRFEPKDFRQRRPDGRDGWIWGLEGVRRVPYRLPKLLAAVEAHRTIFLVEGEKDADRLREPEIDLVATTNAGGAGKWSDDYSHYFQGARVVILPDNDAPGRDHAQKVAASLQGVAREVCILELPGLPEKGDVSDWLKNGGRDVELLDLAEAAALWEPPPATDMPRPAFNTTDVGNGQRLVARHGQDLRFCDAWGRWVIWDGRRWQKDETREIARRAKDAARAIYQEAADENDDTRRKDLAIHARRSEGHSRLQAMIELAASEPGIPARVGDWDADRWLLCCDNGTVDLRTGQLRPHRREDLITKLTSAPYDPETPAPLWEAFLERVLPDADLRGFLQRAVGYALTGDVSEQCLFFLYGSGSNGKSTMLRALMDALGDYALQAAPDLLIAKEGSVGGPNNDVADLQGARFVATVEVEDGKRMAEGLVKQITGGDRIRARFMRQDYFEFEPTHKIFLAANHRPTIRGNDYAIWRRIKVLPFEVQIPDAEKDPRLPEKLRRELPGILAWAVRGCVEWRRQGLEEPEAVKVATEEYREEQDVLRDFLFDCCVLRPSLEVTASGLYKSYCEWCEENSERPLGKKNFGQRLREQKGIRSVTGVGPNSARGWVGIALVDKENRPPDDVSDKSEVKIPMNGNFKNPRVDYPEKMSETSSEHDNFTDLSDLFESAEG